MLPLERQNAYRARYARWRPGWRSSGDELEALVRSGLGPETHLLDLGCGRGGLAERVWPEVRLAAGVDPDWPSLREQRAPLPLVCGRGETLPFADGAFDVVLAVWVLEHVAQPLALLREVRRVLRPAGRFIFLTPNARHPLIRLNRLSQQLPALQQRLVAGLYGRASADTFQVHYRANTAPRLAALAGQAGLRIDSLRVIADPSYLAFHPAFFWASVGLEACLPAGWGVHLLGSLVPLGQGPAEERGKIQVSQRK